MSARAWRARKKGQFYLPIWVRKMLTAHNRGEHRAKPDPYCDRCWHETWRTA